MSTFSWAGNYIDSTPKEILVTGVYRWGLKDSNDERRCEAGIGDIIIIKVTNLKALLNRANCLLDSGKSIPGCKKQEIRLFLDGRMIKKLAPESGAPQKDEGELQFHLERNAENDETWADLLGSPSGSEFFYRETKVSVGLENEYAENSNVDKFHLTRVREFWFRICGLGLVAYFLVVIYLGAKTNLLKDRGVDASSVGIPYTNVQRYSLSRFQMAFWFSLVIASFMFIWLITGAYDLLTPGVLTLIGISAGTSLSAIVIDSNKGEELIKQTADLQKEESSLVEQIKTLQEQDNKTGIAEKQARLKQVQAEIQKNTVALTHRSDGFLKDLLTDVHGVSFHRLQMFVWTFVLGTLFIYSVWVRLAMPDFSATLLALQGITAGTYLGFKIPEKQT